MKQFRFSRITKNVSKLINTIDTLRKQNSFYTTTAQRPNKPKESGISTQKISGANHRMLMSKKQSQRAVIIQAIFLKQPESTASQSIRKNQIMTLTQESATIPGIIIQIGPHFSKKHGLLS